MLTVVLTVIGWMHKFVTDGKINAMYTLQLNTPLHKVLQLICLKHEICFFVFAQVVNYSDNRKSLKLADFGLATEVKSPMFLVCGTPTYVAPEILDESGYVF